MQQNEIMLKVENVSKVYRLGEIGGTTLRESLQRTKARILKKEDPTKKIGAKNYNKGEKFRALDDISFEVKKGERIGIIGHNGAGKSTLLKLISRVTGPTEGIIYLNGRVASMLEVGTGFHGELTGRENVYMNGAILGMTKKEIDAKIDKIIEFSEVRQFIDTPVKRYSSGMYVKLAFSVAAHLDSEIMIMDEVLAVGDMAFQNKCLTKMREVSEQDFRTILYVSHNMNTIKQLCNRVIVLNQGKIIFDGDVLSGITKYLGLRGAQLSYEYSAQDHSTSKDHRLTIQSFRFVNKKSSYYSGDIIRGELDIYAEKSFSDVLFRIELIDESNQKIGTCFSNRFSIKNGKNVLSINFDTKLLVKGQYYADIVIFEYNDKGYENLLDGIKKGIVFNIDFCLSEFNVVNWKRGYWGSIHLPDLNVVVKE